MSFRFRSTMNKVSPNSTIFEKANSNDLQVLILFKHKNQPEGSHTVRITRMTN